jgi:imidazolonepropionase-like amidohydrolase
MSAEQAKHFTALVWCPASNQFLYHTTADIKQLKQRTQIVFGTDSTLSAEGTIWDHLRLARNNGALTDYELFDAVTAGAAELWGLKTTGRLRVGADADMVIAKKKNNNLWDAFFGVTPSDIQLVIRGGNVLLFDESLKMHFNSHDNFFPIAMNGANKFTVIDVKGLRTAIEQSAPLVSLPNQF